MWLWKRFCPKVSNQVVEEVIPVGTETRTVIGQEDGQIAGVQQVNRIFAVTQNVNQVLTYDKLSLKIAFVSLIILVSGVCGVVSLYIDASILEAIWLFRLYQFFISLNLIILIPVRYRRISNKIYTL